MNDNEDFIGLIDNGDDVSLNGNSDVSLESDSSSTTQDGSEEIIEGSDEVSLYASEEGSETSGNIEERLENIESTITNLENYQSSIVDTLEVMEYNNSELLGVNVNMFYLMVGVSIACFFMIIYNWLNNFIK